MYIYLFFWFENSSIILGFVSLSIIMGAHSFECILDHGNASNFLYILTSPPLLLQVPILKGLKLFVNMQCKIQQYIHVWHDPTVQTAVVGDAESLALAF